MARESSRTNRAARRFQPYKSVLNFASAPRKDRLEKATEVANEENHDNQDEDGEGETEPSEKQEEQRPWRQRAGVFWLQLDSSLLNKDADLTAVEEDDYVRILRRTFVACTEQPMGLGPLPGPGEEGDWAIDVIGQVAGGNDDEVLYAGNGELMESSWIR